MSTNVSATIGASIQERTSRVIHEIGADVIALQEADTRFGERTGILDLAGLERETGLLPGTRQRHGKSPRLARQCRPVQEGAWCVTSIRSIFPGSSRAAP